MIPASKPKKIPPAFVTGIVLADSRLSDFSKLIFGTVNIIASTKGGEAFRLSNGKLASWHGGRADRSVIRAINDLVEAGYLVRKTIPGGDRWLQVAPAALTQVTLGADALVTGEIDGEDEFTGGDKNVTPPRDKNVTPPMSPVSPAPCQKSHPSKRYSKSSSKSPPLPPRRGGANALHSRAAGAASSSPTWLLGELDRMETALRKFTREHPDLSPLARARNEAPGLMPLQIFIETALGKLEEYKLEKHRPTPEILQGELEMMEPDLKSAVMAAGWGAREGDTVKFPDLRLHPRGGA